MRPSCAAGLRGHQPLTTSLAVGLGELRASQAELRAGQAELRTDLAGLRLDTKSALHDLDREVDTVIDSLADLRRADQGHTHD